MTSIPSVVSGAPAEAWLALVGVLTGALLTSVGVWLTNRANLKQLRIQLEHQTQHERMQSRRDRLEELYVLVGNWSRAFLGNALALVSVMEGKIDYNAYLDFMLKDEGGAKYDYNRLEMIADVYGGETLREPYKQLLAARDSVNKIVADHKKAYKRGEPGASFIKPYLSAQRDFNKAAEQFKEGIAAYARKT